MDSFLKAIKTYIFLSRVGLSLDPGVHQAAMVAKLHMMAPNTCES
jgi:hypothetical protein